jgi:CBS domain-containing protein
MQVRDVMTSDPAFCTPDTPLQEAASLMVQHDCGSVPVVESNQSRRLVGMITDRDITCRTVAQGRNPLEMQVRDAMSQPVVSVTADADFGECCHKMEESQIRRVPVVDGQGRLCGMVSQADVAHTAGPEEVARVVDQVSDPTEVPSQVGGR